MQNRIAIGFGLVIWLLIAIGTFIPLLTYESKAAKTAESVEDWPAHSAVARGSQPALLMFLHPQCPCSRASLNQLDRLVAAAGANLSVTVLFEQPDNVSESWSKSDLWKQARSIPGVNVVLDKNQSESQNFGAETSGETLLYSANGKLLFHGGITPARGHEGDCDSYDRVLALVRGKATPSLDKNAVFGCALFNFK